MITQIEGRTQSLDVAVEVGLLQNPIQAPIERVRRTPGRVLRCNPHTPLLNFSFPFTHRQARSVGKMLNVVDIKKRMSPTFHHGLIGVRSGVCIIA